MDKDLRDAYATLRLVRADLVRTRREKQALETLLSAPQPLNPPLHIEKTCKSRETLQMQHEDFEAQLWRQATFFENRLANLELQILQYSCPKKELLPEIDDNQCDEEIVRLENLALLNKLHSLTATVEQQMETIQAQQAAFALQKDELETTLEVTLNQLQLEKARVADALLEQQAANENYDFLKTQIEILQSEKETIAQEKEKIDAELAAHVHTNTLLKQKLQEKDEERRKWEIEHKERVEHLQFEHQEVIQSLSLKLQQENEKRQQESMNLQRKCVLLELVLSREREEKSQAQEEHNGKLETKVCELTKWKESHASQACEAKHREFQVAQMQAEREPKVKELESALEEKQHQLDELENKIVYAQSHLAKVTTQLAEDATKYENELAKARKKVRNHEVEHERYTNSLHHLETKLQQVTKQLVNTEAELLSKSNDFALQGARFSDAEDHYEKSVQAFTLEIGVLQHEVSEARKALKYMDEERLKFQLLLEQKTQDHANSVQQCESLETQFLASEDVYKLTKMDAFSNPPEAFYSLSESAIHASSSYKSWAHWRSKIDEMHDFFPQFQKLIAAVHGTLELCGSHVNELHVLCDRLEGKETCDIPILTLLRKILQFAVTWKTRIEHEKAFVTFDAVQTLRRRLVDALAQWVECDADNGVQIETNSIPVPTFTITSRETALILQNWTSDRTMQLRVRRWLARMEAYPGVPPLRGASPNHALELPSEGCTLDLEEMTLEVKDAFLLLLIPILKQNRALHVRVFTRFIADYETAIIKCNDRANDDFDNTKKQWAMRIHVQSAVKKQTTHPVLQKLNFHGPPSPLAPTSPASSVSSSSSSARSRRQIIQERLQYLHNNG
ncbi:hypothetical protein CCR75_007010 [Bremia lactucae]|uniref:Uncharacterized protein n=1 Tax=Bremia lactucae TaxID=4779 RepID=A0A976FGR4_BRELC|nr:hypothetical protein CCR75_007010 [Bremia lactucae]